MDPASARRAFYAANLQSFPWIPTRFLLFLFPPETAYAPGVALAALLAALFTYLYCRRAGLSEVAAAAAGWTFACAGFFASRVMAGHLPLLEAYPALPLLLWLADRALIPHLLARRRWDVAWLAVATTCIVVAGHPQIPAYAVGTALLYILWRGRGWLRVQLAGALALGGAMALAAWWPMLLLVQKSTRILNLDTPENDVVFPYRRILALFVPGIDGWPSGFGRKPFTGYPNGSYLFDIGIVHRARAPHRGGGAAGGVDGAQAPAGCAILTWRVWVRPPSWGRCRCSNFCATGSRASPGSPARLFYITTFSLAVALGAGVDALLSLRTGTKLLYAALGWQSSWRCMSSISAASRGPGSSRFRAPISWARRTRASGKP